MNLFANADDFGLRPSVNRAILYCFSRGLINSTSLLPNGAAFLEAVQLTHDNPCIFNVGVHVNFAEGKPISNFCDPRFLDEAGHWRLSKLTRVQCLDCYRSETRRSFYMELEAQIERVIRSKVKITHIDSHYHLHTLPAFYGLFLVAARKYKLKLRLAQAHNAGNHLKFLYRRLINENTKRQMLNYSDLFMAAPYYSKCFKDQGTHRKVEVMLHPDLTETGILIDHHLQTGLSQWLKAITSPAYKL